MNAHRVKVTMNGTAAVTCRLCRGLGGTARPLQKIVTPDGPIVVGGDCHMCHGLGFVFEWSGVTLSPVSEDHPK